MATTITGKLNKPANIFQAGDSTGFGIRLGVKYRDPKTKQDDWCNYSAVIFAKSAGQIQFYTGALVAGAIVEVTSEQLKIDSFQGNESVMLTIDMLNARLGYVFSGQAPNNQQAAPQAQGGYQQQQNNQQQGGFGGQQQQAPRDSQGFTQQQGGFQNQQ
jgi:single-strand DNA-binding protein